ncbi:MAG: InlB B-repeat-containing protein, partial [Lachnospiraceae bacterium]|nr:InlB B-repeat-containing protein [Lachnospiraceae bacterium]
MLVEIRHLFSPQGSQNRKRATGKRWKQGFTLAETLIVVVILGILAAVSFIGIVPMVRDMRQTKLDSMAESLYSSAQNRFSEIYVYGKDADKEVLKTGAHEVTDSSGSGLYYISNTDKGTSAYNYILHGNTSGTGDVFSWMDTHIGSNAWVIEYEPDTCTVSNVFYSDDEGLGGYGKSGTEYTTGSSLFGVVTAYAYDAGSAGSLAGLIYGGEGRDRYIGADRVKERSAVNVGWFGGATPTAGYLSKIGNMSCSVNIVNEEKLYALFTVDIPSVTNEDGNEALITGTGGLLAESGLKFTVSVQDTLANENIWQGVFGYNGTTIYCPTDADLSARILDYGQKGDSDHTVLSWKVMLDDLTDPLNGSGGSSFAQRFKTGESGLTGTFTPGNDIDAVILVENEKGYIPSVADYDTDNSLFAYDEDGNNTTVKVAYGRHLQNLNQATSGYNPGASATVTVEQVANISFGEGSKWQAAYPDRTFIPIYNETTIQSYNGGKKKLSNLTADYDPSHVTGAEISALSDTAKKSAGLFSEFKGTEIKDIIMVDPVICDAGGGAENAGGLAGKTTGGDLIITGCQLYYTEDEYKDLTITGDDDSNWIVAKNNAGGLIGLAENSNVYLASGDGHDGAGMNFAATVVRATGSSSHAGGLIGSATGDMTVNGSYADCYIKGGTVGGLAGSSGGGSSFTNCYSAGFLMGSAETAAGFVPAEVASVTNAYSAFNFDDITAAEDTMSESDAVSANSSGNVGVYPTGTDGALLCGVSDQEKIYGIVRAVTATPSNVYYSYENVNSTEISGISYITGTDLATAVVSGKLDSPFVAASGTTPYNLAPYFDEKLSAYPYPVLSPEAGSLAHFGDWLSPGEGANAEVELYYRLYDQSVYRNTRRTATNQGKIGNAALVSSVISLEEGLKPAERDGYVFVGWFTPDQLFTISEVELEAAGTLEEEALQAAIEALEADEDGYREDVGETGNVSQNYIPTADPATVTIAEDNEAAVTTYKRLYAVYKEAPPEIDLIARLYSGDMTTLITDDEQMTGGEEVIGTTALTVDSKNNNTQTADLITPDSLNGYEFMGWFEPSAIYELSDEDIEAAFPETDPDPAQDGGRIPVVSSNEVTYEDADTKLKLSMEVDGITYDESVNAYRRLYAVYRKAEAYTITVEFRYSPVMGTTELSKADIYQKGTNVEQPMRYVLTVDDKDPITVILPEIAKYHLLTEEDAADLREDTGEDGDLYQPEFVDRIVRIPVDSDGNMNMGGLEAVALNADGTLTLVPGSAYTYVLLYKGTSTTINVEWHMSNSSEASGSSVEADDVVNSDGGISVSDWKEAVIGNVKYASSNGSEAVAKAEVELESGYSEINSLKKLALTEFTGFSYKGYDLNYDNEGTATVKLYFDREKYSLSYDLNSGLYYEGGYSSGLSGAGSIKYVRNLLYGQPIGDYLLSDTYLNRKGYRFNYWEVSELSSTTKTNYEANASEAVMPDDDVIAKAIWKSNIEKVRVDVYYQSNLDDLDAVSEGSQTYELFSTQDMTAESLQTKSMAGVTAYVDKTEDKIGNSLADYQNTSVAFSDVNDFVEEGLTGQDIESYMLPAIMDGTIDLADYHVLTTGTEQETGSTVYTKVTSGSLIAVRNETSNGTAAATALSNAYNQRTYESGALFTYTKRESSWWGGYSYNSTTGTVTEGNSFTHYTRRGNSYTGTAYTWYYYNNNAIYYTSDPGGNGGGAGFYTSATNSGETTLTGYSGYSDVYRFDAAYTGADAYKPYINEAGELVISLYYDRSPYRLVFYYDITRSWGEDARWKWSNHFSTTSPYYVNRLSQYAAITSSDGPVANAGEDYAALCSYGGAEFKVFSKSENKTYTHYSKADSTYYTVPSKKQFIFEGLYGAPYDVTLWNDYYLNPDYVSYKRIIWSQVNNSTIYTAQAPLTVFDSAAPDARNMIEFGFFGEGNVNEWGTRFYIESDSRSSSDSLSLSESDFSEVMAVIAKASDYPTILYQNDENKTELSYVDGYEYWGYKMGNTSTWTDLMGWLGGTASSDKTTDLVRAEYDIQGSATDGYWTKSMNTSYTMAKIYLMRKTYTINFVNAGTVEPVSYLYRESVGQLPVPTEKPYGTEYVFDGWYLDSAYTTQVSDAEGNLVGSYAGVTMPSHNMSLVAKWYLAPHIVSLNMAYPKTDGTYDYSVKCEYEVENGDRLTVTNPMEAGQET